MQTRLQSLIDAGVRLAQRSHRAGSIQARLLITLRFLSATNGNTSETGHAGPQLAEEVGMVKRHGRPSAQYRYEHYDPC